MHIPTPDRVISVLLNSGWHRVEVLSGSVTVLHGEEVFLCEMELPSQPTSLSPMTFRSLVFEVTLPLTSILGVANLSGDVLEGK